jgi:FKBP-type peptidyl-prolyl cis-trans isomerase FkpA
MLLPVGEIRYNYVRVLNTKIFYEVIMFGMKSWLGLSVIIFGLTLASYADAGALTITDVRVGTGEEAVTGKIVNVHYTGWLFDKSAKDNKGKKFDSSRDRPGHFSFPLGAGRVIKGWDQGVQGMKIGGQRTLIIAPSMGYGARGAGNVIPPNATLVFDVELLGFSH